MLASLDPTPMTLHTTHIAHRLATAAFGLTVLSGMAGCGAEVAGSAAVVGGLQAQQATQARQQQAKVVDGLKAAQDAGLARAASAAD
jgi:hypothetical protein